METRVKVMGLEIDVLTEEALHSQLQEYLSNEYLNIAHLVSMDYLEEEPSEVVRTALAEADLVLPGEKAVLNAHHVDVLETGGMVVDYRNVCKIIKQLGLAEKKIYYVMRNKSEAKGFYGLVHSMNMGDTCVGIYVEDSNMTNEALINDINTQLPDLVIVALDKEKQERWIHENRQKMNARLCICIGSILPMIHRENPTVPKMFQILHIEGIYRRIRKLPNSHSFRTRIFKRKMADYNNKRQSEDE